MPWKRKPAAKGKCELEMCERDADVIATVKPLYFIGLVSTPLQRVRLCNECLGKMPVRDVVNVRVYR